MARTAEVKRDARIGKRFHCCQALCLHWFASLAGRYIHNLYCFALATPTGEAEARCDAQIKEAIAEEQRMAARFLNDTEIAKAQRDFELKKAAYDVEVQTKKAEAEMAYELQAAKTKQRIKEEQMQIKVVERTQEIAVQDQEMVRRERELEATVHRPAAAEKYRLERIAEANRNRVILEAEAEAESVSSHAHDSKRRASGVKLILHCFFLPTSDSHSRWSWSIFHLCQGQGWSRTNGQEIRGMARISRSSYGRHAVGNTSKGMLDFCVLAPAAIHSNHFFVALFPQVAAEVAAPLSQAKKITMVSSGTGEVGAAKLTGEVLQIVNKVPELVKSITGVDISRVGQNSKYI